jgi:hypothetical protein
MFLQCGWCWAQQSCNVLPANEASEQRKRATIPRCTLKRLVRRSYEAKQRNGTPQQEQQARHEQLTPAYLASSTQVSGKAQAM